MITQLKINHLRNLSDISLSLGRINVFVGQNGSGKTSLLEAVFLLSRGKSFRHHEAKRYISHHADSCTVWASLGETTLAIAKHKDDSKNQLRYNQSPAPNQSTLTRLLPVLVIDPSGMDILEDGSATRRQLLDFLCFHCEPSFHGVWLDYQRSLKQRNALLKHPDALHSTAIHAQIMVWDKLLSDTAHALHAMRSRVFDKWQDEFNRTINALLPAYDGQIYLSYQAGFDTDSDLQTLLKDRLSSDIELGYTRIGSHRADLAITLKTPLANGKTHKEQAVNVLSRGQKKLLITALKLSGLPQLCEQTDHQPIVLVDDIDSELDDRASALLLAMLVGLPCQVFVSSLDKKIVAMIKEISEKELVVFGVEQGVVKSDE